ncbi:dienelactone hydrolase [Glonium stellatum]|uniref:Dienelactone hydrolase n=1 Tax=Glonium stellatum TaxID=574774 RepID=A0A8E2JZG7_9PEZI|nr:dienelactone hydrolase [Glonium stellatum]
MASKSGYIPKGRYDSIGAWNAYVTGNESSKTGILEVTDAFGLVPPTIRGADLLAELTNSVVVLPDYFHGQPALISWITEDGSPVEETKDQYIKFVAEKAQAPENLPNVLKSMEEVKRHWPDINTWGGLGIGWGGKETSGPETPFKASGQAFPSRPAREDVERFTIPHICLASQTDNKEGIAAYAELLNGKAGEVETYDIYHGWMGARAMMDDLRTVNEFERGYNQLANFFIKHL